MRRMIKLTARAFVIVTLIRVIHIYAECGWGRREREECVTRFFFFFLNTLGKRERPNLIFHFPPIIYISNFVILYISVFEWTLI